MVLSTAALSDIGHYREANEDYFACDDSLGFYAVADGIGGLPGGAEAAECAVESVRRQLGSPDDWRSLAEITAGAHSTVIELGSSLSPGRGVGTTLTWGVFRGNLLHLAHVGDTRCYCLRKGHLACLTRDHSWANESRRLAGALRSRTPRDPNTLTRCIGQPVDLEVDVFAQAVSAGDWYLLCSDGVCRGMPEKELYSLLASGADPQSVAHRLVGAANRHGGRDNATVVLVRVEALD